MLKLKVAQKSSHSCFVLKVLFFKLAKKYPQQFTQKVTYFQFAQKEPQPFYIISTIFQISPNGSKIFGLLLSIKFVTKNLQKYPQSSHTVSIPPSSSIWVICSQRAKRIDVL